MIKQSILAPVLLLLAVYLFLNPGGSEIAEAVFAAYWPIIFVIPLGIWMYWRRPLHQWLFIPIRLLTVLALLSLAVFSLEPVLPRVVFVQPLMATAILLGGIWLMFARKQEW